MTTQTLAELAETLGTRLIGDPTIAISGVAGVREARPGDITFLVNPRYEAYLATTRASAVILAEPRADCALAQLVCDDPYFAFLRTVKIFRQERPRPPAGVHPTAVIGPNVKLGEGVSVGPCAVIEEGAVLGDGAVVMAHSYVGHNTQLGKDAFLYPQVVVREDCRLGDRVVVHSGTVIGADGFGYARNGDTYYKVPQVGNVVLEDDVEIGANVCVDRATTGTTRVGRGSKIDNLVQIGHNVDIAENVIVAAMSGIAGSTRVYKDVTIGAQAGINGHIEIGEGAVVAARGGVTKSVAPGVVVSGVFPARPYSIERRIQASIAKLPQLVQRLHQLEQRLAALEDSTKDSAKDSTKDSTHSASLGPPVADEEAETARSTRR
ncbi:MAG: UDP-3-O-(3-hydroxymyristoyl)glucosamine N-acyltransferase [Candidatus Eiseniibacteriota bacterium]